MKREDLSAMEALVGLLEDWARWQSGYRLKLGYPTRSACVSGTGMATFDEMCDAVDHECMQITDSAITDLPPAWRAAVLRRYGVAAVFRFPRDNYEECLCMAHVTLLETLPKRGVLVL